MEFDAIQKSQPRPTLRPKSMRASMRASKSGTPVRRPSLHEAESEEEGLITKVLILYAGGTIGMKSSAQGYAPVPKYFENKMKSIPSFHEQGMPPYTTPVSRYGRRINWSLYEYDNLIDSSNASMADWMKIAKDIQLMYDQYDSFVVLHGTDTMSFTASALSFILGNLRKTVIVTGSAIPLSVEGNDAEENLRGSLFIAGHYEIPEVCLFFNQKLFRGNRTTKHDATGLDAFGSPNFPALMTLGVNIDVEWDRILSPPVGTEEKVTVATRLEPHIGVLKIFPGISTDTIRNFLRPPLRGCVLESYGTGNAPDNRKDFLDALKEANEHGVVIVNVTQCGKGSVGAHYAAGTALLRAGVVPGYDLTTEAALSKLAFLLGRDDITIDQVRSMFSQSIAGEVSIPNAAPRFSFKDQSFVRAIANALSQQTNRSSDQDFKNIERALVPVLLCSAAGGGDLDQLRTLMQSHSSLVDSGDYDQRTALHLAASEGRFEVVQELISRGANVNVRDRWGGTPLNDALRGNHTLIVEYLKRHGAVETRENPRIPLRKSLDMSAAEQPSSTNNRDVSNPPSAPIISPISSSNDLTAQSPSAKSSLHSNSVLANSLMQEKQRMDQSQIRDRREVKQKKGFFKKFSKKDLAKPKQNTNPPPLFPSPPKSSNGEMTYEEFWS